MIYRSLAIVASAAIIGLASVVNGAEQMGMLSLPLAEGVTVQSQGDRIAIVFKTTDGQLLGAAVPKEKFPLFVADAINQGAAGPPEELPREITVKPMQVTQMGWGKGRSPNEVLLNLRVGNLNMTFAIDKTKFLEFSPAPPVTPPSALMRGRLRSRQAGSSG
jgi:hypothetical protein